MSDTQHDLYDPASITSFLTTEHFTLQSARGVAVSESNGRLSSFLTVLSAMMVALALIAQVSGIGDLFYTFALVLFPVVIFIGISTHLRVLQLSMADLTAVRAMNRIRRFFQDAAPESARYLTLPTTDDNAAIGEVMHVGSRRMQGAVSMTALLMVLNSLLAGVFVAVIATRLYASQTLVIGAGIIGGAAAFVLLIRAAARTAQQVLAVEPRFPTQGPGGAA